MRNERYYYGIMTDEEKRIYKIIYNALKARSYTIDIATLLPPEKMQEIYLLVLFDNPLLYYVNQTVIKMVGSPGEYSLLPEYLYSNKEIEKINKDIRSVVDRINEKAKTLCDNEFRLEKFLHDSVVKSVAYDYDSLKKSDCFDAHSIVGAFLDNRAVCEGIAKAFKLLCNEYGIKCIVVLGKGDPNCEFGEDTYHAWNLVKIGDESYHVDPTWDNMYEGEDRHISYDYFNLTTEDIMKDHIPMCLLPECTAKTLNYFNYTNSYVSTYNELYEMIKNRIDSKAIMFKFNQEKEEFLSHDEVEMKAFIALSHTMLTKNINKPFKILINDPQNTGKILFA